MQSQGLRSKTLIIYEISRINHILPKPKGIYMDTPRFILIDGNAISIVGTEEAITDIHVKAEKDMVLRIGKKRFVKMVLS